MMVAGIFARPSRFLGHGFYLVTGALTGKSGGDYGQVFISTVCTMPSNDQILCGVRDDPADSADSNIANLGIVEINVELSVVLAGYPWQPRTVTDRVCSGMSSASDEELLARQSALQAEAREVLAGLNLAALVADIGPLAVTGSFVSGLMCRRELDVMVCVGDDFSPRDVLRLLQQFWELFLLSLFRPGGRTQTGSRRNRLFTIAAAPLRCPPRTPPFGSGWPTWHRSPAKIRCPF